MSQSNDGTAFRPFVTTTGEAISGPERALLRRWLHSVAPRAVEGQAETFDALIADTKSLLEGVEPAPERQKCPDCGGQGWYAYGETDAPQQVQCERCLGTGRVAPAPAPEPRWRERLIARLMEALRPFARWSFEWPNTQDEITVAGHAMVTVGDLRRAQAALDHASQVAMEDRGARVSERPARRDPV